MHGSIVACMGDCTTGVEKMRTALDKALEMRTPTETAVCHSCLAYTFVFTGDLESSVEHAETLIATAEQSGDQMYRYLGYAWQSWAKSRMGQYAAADKSMARSRQIAREQGERVLLTGLFTAVTAETALGAGDVERALDLAKSAAEIGSKESSTSAQGLALRIWGQALLMLDPQQSEKAEALMQESVCQFEKMQYMLEAARSRVALGRLYSSMGDPENARKQWQTAAEQWQASGLDHELKRVRELLASSS
jgi:tetratricopeptide (TPR) repeat protein